jgi:hypothetical protein
MRYLYVAHRTFWTNVNKKRAGRVQIRPNLYAARPQNKHQIPWVGPFSCWTTEARNNVRGP